MVLPVISRIAQGGVVWSATERRAARKIAEAVDLQERYLHFKIDELSGGNQQKALLARVIMTGARTLLLFDPTRVDVGTKQSIYEAVRKFAADGDRCSSIRPNCPNSSISPIAASCSMAAACSPNIRAMPSTSRPLSAR